MINFFYWLKLAELIGVLEDGEAVLAWQVLFELEQVHRGLKFGGGIKRKLFIIVSL